MTTQSSYQVIARRWRPKQFDEIVGQEHIVRTLKNAIETGRIAHAYLFVGPRGTGKTTTARIFAKALNAEGGPSVAPDDNSEISKAILSGSCMDVIEIDGASNNGVEDVRQLREDVQYAPSQGNFKVYIIDEVHMLSNNAWNALLKTLEEPPAHVKFIFATTEAHKVLPTVVSRCQRFEFRPIPDAQIIGRLRQIAEAEQIDVDDAALSSVARMADGGMRDAQSILDQLISFCGKSITEQNVLDVYGLASREDIEAIVKSMAAADYEGLFAKIEELAAQGRDLYRILLDIQTRVREALVEAIHAGGRSATLGTPLSAESLTRMLEAIQQGEDAVRTGLSQRVNFEVALLRAIDQSRSRAIDSVIKSLTQIAAGLPEDAGQKKIETSPAAAADSYNSSSGGNSDAVAAASATDANGLPVAGVSLSTPFDSGRPARRMRFPMLGGGESPFERPPVTGGIGSGGNRGAATGAGASGGASSAAARGRKGGSGAGAASGDLAGLSANDGASALAGGAVMDAQGVADELDDEFSPAAYSPFSTPAEEGQEGGFASWDQSLAQLEGSEFIANPDDEDEDSGSGSFGGGALAVGKLGSPAVSGSAAIVAQDAPAKIFAEKTPQFQAALEAVPERARHALEAFLRVQFRHLEQRGGN